MKSYHKLFDFLECNIEWSFFHFADSDGVRCPGISFHSITHIFSYFLSIKYIYDERFVINLSKILRSKNQQWIYLKANEFYSNPPIITFHDNRGPHQNNVVEPFYFIRTNNLCNRWAKATRWTRNQFVKTSSWFSFLVWRLLLVLSSFDRWQTAYSSFFVLHFRNHI